LIRAVRQLAERGMDIIKIMVSVGLMTVSTDIPSGRESMRRAVSTSRLARGC
jgi:hypothetical protein